ncbi:putative zinc finger [Lyophyllum shimeji]|uniref:Zinc finger n=1 Tax=Lyophyllum shimeji TaxID=47721 RepID=A0A9P3UQ62_LYOSH|nr:putative zinc finger [Lyophyllum shimeji]
MVRTSTNEPSEDKKETTKKRTAPRKKTVVTGVWPCKINGCNKQFAREADLKRHQRTTKLHSMPGFSCPQCDATFTRTDALRRHQKSRHNGVIVEPSEDSKDDMEEGSSGSQSKSRSATPSSKGKEKAPAPPAVNAQYPVQTTRSGPSSYYRQHTMTTSGPYVPRPPIMDPHYSQVGLPTSATRLNMATHWGYPHPWPDGTPQQMSYQHMYYSTHYRPNGVSQPLGQPSPPPPPTAVDPQTVPNGAATGAQETPPPPPGPPHQSPHATKPPSDSTCAETPPADSSAPVIDPSLNASDSTTLTEEQVLELTQAAMKAVLEAEAERANSRETSASTPTVSEGDKHGCADAPDEDKSTLQSPPSRDESHPVHGYGLRLGRPEPMEHMLTEDGEPMLNPAELLTQESLASPPPS